MPVPADLADLPGASDTVHSGRNTGSCCHIHAHEEAVVFQLLGTKVFTFNPPADVRSLYFEPVTRDCAVPPMFVDTGFESSSLSGVFFSGYGASAFFS